MPQKEKTTRFFDKTAANHPDGTATNPNWFYYWKDGQVYGINANCRYDPTASFGYTLPGTDNLIRLGPHAPLSNTGPETWSSGSTNYGFVVATGQGKGFKCVAETIQHEQQHLDIYNSFNSRIATAHANGDPNNGDPDDDPDSDAIPNVEEPSFDGINSDPNDPDTFNMGGGYSSYGDNEVRCRKIEFNLTIPIHPDLDWANPGCQSNVWSNANCTGKVTLPASWSANAMPKTLYVEGITNSAAVRDVGLKLEYDENPAGQNNQLFKCADIIKLTVLKVEFKTCPKSTPGPDKPHNLNMKTRQNEEAHYAPSKKCTSHIWSNQPLNMAQYLAGGTRPCLYFCSSFCNCSTARNVASAISRAISFLPASLFKRKFVTVPVIGTRMVKP